MAQIIHRASSGLYQVSPSQGQTPVHFKTSDGDGTNFTMMEMVTSRVSSNLAGKLPIMHTDEFGRITATRDSLAADAIATGVRSTDDTVTTQLSYDTLGRITAIKHLPRQHSNGRSNLLQL